MCSTYSTLVMVPLSSRLSSFDHLVGQREQPVGNFKAERLCGLEIDRQLVLGRVLHRKVGRLLAPEDAINVAGGAPVRVGRVGRVGDEAAAADEVGAGVDAGSACRAASAMIKSR